MLATAKADDRDRRRPRRRFLEPEPEASRSLRRRGCDLRYGRKDRGTGAGFGYQAAGYLGQVIAAASCVAAQQFECVVHGDIQALAEESFGLLNHHPAGQHSAQVR